MSEILCPNYQSCKLVNDPGFATAQMIRDNYIAVYCVDGKQQWESCKRFQTKEMLGFCPDFVFPDTAMTIDEIIDKFDENSEI